MAYRADWEPEAASGKMYGWCPWGVLEVPSSIMGTTYTKSNLGSTEALILKNWLIYGRCGSMWDHLAQDPPCHVVVAEERSGCWAAG